MIITIMPLHILKAAVRLCVGGRVCACVSEFMRDYVHGSQKFLREAEGMKQRSLYESGPGIVLCNIDFREETWRLKCKYSHKSQRFKPAFKEKTAIWLLITVSRELCKNWEAGAKRVQFLSLFMSTFNLLSFQYLVLMNFKCVCHFFHLSFSCQKSTPKMRFYSCLII